jgi:glutathione peroxidase
MTGMILGHSGDVMSFHDFTMGSISGEPVSLAQFKGKTCLVVNVASKCGLTPQYAGLQKLHEDHEGNAFTVLGFPCNQFAGQEPGSNEEIQTFCSSRYAVSFPLFAKVAVNGSDTCALYELLKAAAPNEDGTQDIPWNFTKFLVDGSGEVVKRYGPRTTPEEIAEDLANYL